MVEGGVGLINKNPPPASLYLFGHRGALAKPIWRYQDPLKWYCKGQSLSLTCWLHYVQLCTSRDSRLHHDADIEVELKGSDLTQIHAKLELSSETWVQSFFKHFLAPWNFFSVERRKLFTTETMKPMIMMDGWWKMMCNKWVLIYAKAREVID